MPIAIALWVAGCEVIVGIEEGTLGYCTDDTGATNPLVDDGNPCTVSKCVGNTSVHEPGPDGTLCARGPNGGKCAAGICELICESDPDSCACATEADCPMNDACATWGCMSGQCTRTISADGTQVDTLEQRDCKKTVCISGTPQAAADELDIPDDVADDCKMPACDGMNPSTTNDDTDAPSDMTPGDCQTFVCQNGTAIMGPDDTDKPADNECAVYSCLNGAVSPQTAQVGTACSAGACDSKGQCADCLSQADWTACGGIGCPVKLCDGETCAADDSRCKSGACDDGICCNVACNDVCKSCNLAGSMGVCTNIPYYQEDPYYGTAMTCDPPIAGSVCDGNGKCLKIIGTPCTQGTQCISNVCTNTKCLGAVGEACFANAECVSNMCTMGVCK